MIMDSKNFSLLFVFFFPIISLIPSLIHSSFYVNFPKSLKSPAISLGHWDLLHASIGVSAMHIQVLKNNKVVIFDRTDMGPSNLTLPFSKTNHHCPLNYTDEYNLVKPDCTAHSVLYDISSNTFRPLVVVSDTWCSSGSVDGNGTLVQTGGYGAGIRKIRTFSPCNDDQCDWIELNENLTHKRWYATNQVLPDGRVIVMGGRRVFTYEFVPKNTIQSPSPMKFLEETTDPYEENNLYPFLHLLPDGNLFVFANKRSILFDHKSNKILKELPIIPGKDKRNYPSTGSSVLLPLRLNASGLPEAEVLICGGAPPGAYIMSNFKRVFVSASRSCGRIKLTDPDPKWATEKMPMPRVMSDMLLLPTGDVIIINGASKGSAGWEDAVSPVFNPLLYKPNELEMNRRFSVLNPSKIPRLYHSSAVLLPDGRILVGGSNPHRRYNFTAYPYPTDLSLEGFNPPYLDPRYYHQRPTILTGSNEKMVSYGQRFSVSFSLRTHRPNPAISVSLIMPSFSTHSVAMNQRMVVLEVATLEQLSIFSYRGVVSGPPNANVAPPGYYMLFVVHAGIPSPAVWVKVQ